MINNIRAFRDNAGLSQSDLAEAVKVSRQTIHSIESGKFVPTTILALKLAYFFRTTVEDLFELEESEMVL